ncbi:MAG: ABC transporter ATP-binding protein [Pseudomonadota bacterium]
MSNGANGPALEAIDLSKGFHQGDTRLTVLSGLNLSVQPGERIAILGPSGSGKSTLLHCLAGLDEPDAGTVSVGGQRLTGLVADAQARLRSRYMGFVYQAHHLLPEFSAAENVAMPLRIRGQSQRSAIAEATTLLDRVGLSERLRHRPAQLSGGERQRVAVARALVNRPAVVLADEPTGNLDRDNADRIFRLLIELSESSGTAVLVVTHDPTLCNRMHRSVELRGGALQARPDLAGT